MSSRKPRRKRGDPSSEEEEEEAPLPVKRSTRASTRNPVSATSNTSTATRSTSNAKANKGKGPPGLSKTEEATRRELEKRRAAAAVALKKKEDEEIRKRTAEMLEQEQRETERDSSPPPVPPPKRKKKTHTPLDEDEEAFAASLGNPMDLDLDLDLGLKRADTNDGDDDDEGPFVNGEKDQSDEDLAESDKEEQVKQDQVDGMLEFEDTSNGIVITDPPVKSKGKGHRRPASTTSNSVTSYAKLSEHDFSPAQYRLACLVKTKIRERISLENAWPDDNKETFTWTIFKQVVGDNEAMIKVFQQANKDEGLKDRLITYVFYTVGGLRGDIKRRAKGNISGHFQIPGTKTPQQIAKQVRWLLELDHFIYGDIKYDENTDKYSYNKDAPFSHQIIADIIREQWYSTKGKNDKAVFRYMVEKKLVPYQIIILVICGAKSSLKEWQSGIRQNLEFCYDAMKSRYLHYIKKWNRLVSKSPTFAAYLEKTLFNNIILSLGKPHLAEEKEEEDGLDDFDFDGMEAFAISQGA